MRMKLFFIFYFLIAFVLCCKAQDSSVNKSELKQITMKPGKHTNEKIFLYGDEIIKGKDVVPYLLKFNNSAAEYSKAKRCQKAVYYTYGSAILMEGAGLLSLKHNRSLGEGLMITAGVGIGTSIYFVIKRNAHRNKAIKLYNQGIL